MRVRRRRKWRIRHDRCRDREVAEPQHNSSKWGHFRLAHSPWSPNPRGPRLSAPTSWTQSARRTPGSGEPRALHGVAAAGLTCTSERPDGRRCHAPGDYRGARTGQGAGRAHDAGGAARGSRTGHLETTNHALDDREDILDAHSRNVFGAMRPGRPPQIMVTLPGEALADPQSSPHGAGGDGGRPDQLRPRPSRDLGRDGRPPTGCRLGRSRGGPGVHGPAGPLTEDRPIADGRAAGRAEVDAERWRLRGESSRRA